MAAQVYPSSTRLQFSYPHSKFNQPRFSSFSLRTPRLHPIICSASNVKPKKHSPSASTKNKNLNSNPIKKNKKKNSNKSGVDASDSNSVSDSSPPHIPTQLPRPPAGFAVDNTGKLLTASNDRIATSSFPKNKNLNNNHSKKKKKKNYNKSDAEASDSNSISDSSPPHIPTQLPHPPAGFAVDDTGKLLTASNDRIAASSSIKNKNLNNNHNKKKNNNKTHIPTQLPSPPAGFVVDDTGKLLTASNDRIATLVDPTNNLPLKCVIKRVFTSSEGDECVLLCPLDMPIHVLRSSGDGWAEVSYEELEPLLPAAAFALAKLRIHLVYSGYRYTARGGVMYSEEDIFEIHAEGQGGGLATEAVKITRFNEGGEHYMIYTPSDPLVFIAAKDQNGMLQIADEELLEDPAVIRARDEETEFNALVVEEEAALLDSLFD